MLDIYIDRVGCLEEDRNYNNQEKQIQFVKRVCALLSIGLLVLSFAILIIAPNVSLALIERVF